MRFSHINSPLPSITFCFAFCISEGVNGSTSELTLPSKTDEPKQSESSLLVFTPNVIVHVCSRSPLNRADLKVPQLMFFIVVTNYCCIFYHLRGSMAFYVFVVYLFVCY